MREDSMDSVSEEGLYEEGLKSRLSQLRTESAVFERIVYKNRNQHRRTPYFQRLLKVKRDLCLLDSARLEEILKLSFQAIRGKNPKQRIYILERLKRDTNHDGKHTFLDRLLGVARLLSQMVEPILKSGIEISSLLAMSFFTAFALTTLALLGRLRVLIQQILLDIVSVFNAVSVLAKKEQSFQLTHEGVKVFRDFYSANKEYLTLECVWEGDKFCLLETLKSNIKNEGPSEKKENSDGVSNIHYETMGRLVEGSEDRLDCENATMDRCTGNWHSPSRNKLYSKLENDHHSGAILSNNVTREENVVQCPSELPLKEESTSEGVNSSANQSSLDLKMNAREKVSFISVRKSAEHGKVSKLKKASVDIEDFKVSESPRSAKGGREKVAETTLSARAISLDSKAEARRKYPLISIEKSVEHRKGRKFKKARLASGDFGVNDSSGSPKKSDDYFFNLLTAGSVKGSIF